MRIDRVKKSLVFFFLTHSLTSFSFENTNVLPQGIRSVKIQQMSTIIRSKYLSSGEKVGIGYDLEKDVLLSLVAKQKGDGVNAQMTEAFLTEEKGAGLKLDDKIGKFRADLAASVRVTIPYLSYGLTENLTLAFVMPIYQANSGVKVGFEATKKGNDFVAALTHENNNKVEAARELSSKLSHSGLNSKLTERGYAPLENWSKAGFGDMIFAAKYRFYNQKFLKASSSLGLILPTGTPKDPDVLNSVPFGEGAVGVFANITSDQPMSDWFFLNEYVKGTFNFPSMRTVRLKTEEEPLPLAKERLDFHLGHKIEAGLSAQINADFGLTCGLGYVFEKKFADTYSLDKEPLSKRALEKDTDSITNHVEATIGYSSLNAYKKKQVPLPLMASVGYKKQFMSRNALEKDLFSFDLTLFF
jgi:hypothetical protein